MNFNSDALTDKIRRIDPQNPEPDIIEESVLKIKSGGVIVFPTASLYGLGADALNPHAVLKVFEIKHRPPEKALPVLIGDRAELNRLIKNIPSGAESIIKAFWPGNVTLICESRGSVSAVLSAGTGKIAVRMAGHPVASALVKKMNGPITATSANLSGSPGINTIDRIDPALAGKVDLILDAGVLRGGVGSTIVDMTSAVPVIVREGSITAKRISDIINRQAKDG